MFGEHAVVYGKPGIAMAIKPRVFVTVRNTKRPQRAKSAYIDGCFEALGVMGSLPIDDLIRISDVVTINCPLNEDTRLLMNAERFRAMKKTAILVNCARGPIVDEKALYEALMQGEILGAGLDVFEHEPIDADNSLLTLPNVVVSPHTAAATRDTAAKMAQRAFENMQRVAEGLAVGKLYLVAE